MSYVRAIRPATVTVDPGAACPRSWSATLAATPSSSPTTLVHSARRNARLSANTVTETDRSPLTASADRGVLLTLQPAGAVKPKPDPSTVSAAGAALPPQPAATSTAASSSSRFGAPAAGKTDAATKRKDGPRMARTSDKVRDSATSVKPYVERALHDEQLRDNVKNAFDSARAIYDELIGNRGLVTTAGRVATDKDIQDQLRKTVEELRTAADRLQGKKQQHAGRNSTLLLIGI